LILPAIVEAKLVAYYLTRDRYDPCVIRDAGLLSVVTAMTLKRGLSRAFDDRVTLAWLMPMRFKTSHNVQVIRCEVT